MNFDNIKTYLSKDPDNSLRDIRENLEIFNLKLININNLENFSLCPDREFNMKIKPKFEKLLYYAYKLECDLITVQPSFEVREIPKWRIIRRTKKKLKILTKIAYDEDINIGFEYMSLPNSSINNLEAAKLVLQPLYSYENLGYIIDTFYFGKNETDFEELFEIKDHIFLIQLADFIKVSEEKLRSIDDNNREFPGMGSFDLHSFIKYTKEIYYRDFYSIELSKNTCENDLYERYLNIIS
ncbi:MAG: hypothetical protein GF317_10800 [Candidatus Lokiarchaeota archaeon]|nr:hypothetical protein [Candidatus Lokiarchaeota archaeon]MBD3200150.1 hypothetical protein [Candidatus Lokiarchaeota archaeon]